VSKQSYLQIGNPRKSFYLLLFIAVAITALGSKQAQLQAENLPQCGISVNFRTYVQDANLQEAVFAALCSETPGLFAGDQFAVTSERDEGDWRLISIASLNGPQCTPEYIGSGKCGSLILAIKDLPSGWDTALAGTPLFSSYLSRIPDALLSPEAKTYLDPVTFSSAKEGKSSTTLGFKFPWPTGNWEYWHGWEHSPTPALDIGVHGTTADTRVLASNDGYISHICRSSNGQSANITINHVGGVTLEYYHLDKSSLGSGIIEGRPVLRGQLLGHLLPGSFNDSCGNAVQSGAHLHWVIPTDNDFTADGWTIQYPDNTWRKGAETRVPTLPYQTLPSSNYLLVSQTKPFDTWVPWPGGWPYHFQASDSRVRHLLMDDWFSYDFEGSCDSFWLNLERGNHSIVFWYEMRENDLPTVNVNAWPTVPSTCAIEPTDPPPSDDPPLTNDGATFIADITLPDGILVSPNQSLLKTWRLRNSGTSTWAGYQLVFVSGEQMGAPSTVAVPHTAPGQTVDVSVNLTAPNNNGEHTGYWRLRNSQGTFFGPTIWMKINVGTASSYISVLTTDPASPADTNQVTIHARADNFPNFRSMRLKIDGHVVHEIGAPEFYYNWQTGDSTLGEHSISVEVADWTDSSWSHPETRSTTYVLTGNGAPANHVPYPPNLTSPDNWHVYYSGSTAQLCAQATGDPDGDSIAQYQFDIYDSAQLWNSGWTNSSCITTGSLGPYTYQWRVKVKDSRGAESGWSEPRHFTLVNPNLTITELYFEPQDANRESVKIRTCTAGQGGIGITMRVSVNEANDGSDNGEWHTLKELGVPCFNADDAPVWYTLEYGEGTHLVRVEAHGSNTGWDGAAVREATYSLPYRRPPGNHLVAPIPTSGNTRDTIYLNSRTVTFRWQPALRATSLVLHVGTTLSPKDDPNPVYRQSFAPSVTEQQITFSQDYPTLYWQLEAVNSAGTSASGDQKFGIDRTAPSCSIETLPGTTFENVFQVSWSTSDGLSGVDTANIQYRDSRESEWRNWLTGIPAAKTYDLFFGEAGHSYQFRCQATDIANNDSAYSQPSNQIQVDPSARPPETWWSTAYTFKRGILVLNNMPAKSLPVGYPIHIRFDDTTTPTAADIYNASATPIKCNDLRVVYDNSTELDRFIARCQTNEIDLWFQSQAAISPGTVDDSSYRLYYGNASAGTPPADQTIIWYPQLDANTVGLWYFSEGSGSTTLDYSGHNNNGAIGILNWVDGKSGKALGSPYPGPGPNGVYIPGNASLGSSVFTLEFFAKRYDMGSEGYIAGMGMSGSGRERMRLLIDSPGKIKFQVDPEPGGASDIWANSGCLPDLNWHHVAVTFDGNRTGKIYCDGALAGSGLFNESGISSLNFDLHLGSDFSTGTRFNGTIDQVRLSNIVRTSFPYAAQALVTSEPSTAVGDSIEPPTGNQPDLSVVALHSYPNPDGGVLLEAVLRNEGLVPTQNGFFTDLYWNHLPSGPGDYTDSLQFWVNSPIQAGETITVSTVVHDIPSLQAAGVRNVGSTEELSGAVYVQVDSTDAVGEANSTNNISSQGTQVCLASADSYEDDNSWQDATPLAWNSSQRHNIHLLADEDWFAVQVTANQTYTVKTLSLDSSADTYLYLYDTDGNTLLTSNDDYNGSLASQVDWFAPSTGTYYVQVKHWNPNVGGCDTGYTVLFGETSVYLPVILSNVQAATLPSGQATLYDGFVSYGESGFDFSTDSVVAWNSTMADLLAAKLQTSSVVSFFAPYNAQPFPDADAYSGIVGMPQTDLGQVTECPDSGYGYHWVTANLGGVYCVRTRDGGHYAIIKVTAVSGSSLSFTWEYQPNGSRRFD